MSNAKRCTLRKIELDLKKFEDIERIVSALASKTRLAILSILLEYNEACTCELTSALNIAQPTVTVHLQKLYNVGVVKKRESWRYTYYFIDKRYIQLIKTVLKLNS